MYRHEGRRDKARDARVWEKTLKSMQPRCRLWLDDRLSGFKTLGYAFEDWKQSDTETAVSHNAYWRCSCRLKKGVKLQLIVAIGRKRVALRLGYLKGNQNMRTVSSGVITPSYESWDDKLADVTLLGEAGLDS